MLSASSAFDQENLFLGSNVKPRATGPALSAPRKVVSNPAQRKALGEITNTPIRKALGEAPVRKALGEITNKQPSGSLQHKLAPIQKQGSALSLAPTVKRAAKKTTKSAKVPEVEKIYSFNPSPMPDVPGLDFDVRQFLAPIANVPYCCGDYTYASSGSPIVPIGHDIFEFDVPSIGDIPPMGCIPEFPAGSLDELLRVEDIVVNNG